MLIILQSRNEVRENLLIDVREVRVCHKEVMFTSLFILCMFEFVSHFSMLSINSDDSDESKNVLTRGIIVHFLNNSFTETLY